MWRIWWCVVVLSASVGIRAEQLALAMSTEAYKAFEHTQSMRLALEAFTLAGHNVTIKVVPGERALRLANSGELDGDLFRQPQAVSDFPHLIPVQVPIHKAKYYVYVFSNRECPLSIDDITRLKPIGLSGLKYFELVYAKSEVGFLQVDGMKLLTDSLRKRRADFTVAPIDLFGAYDKLDGAEDFKPCFEQPLFETQSYIYLHAKHQPLIPALEAALISLGLSYP
ncbi:hypothetical protein [Vibrio paucivorans]